MTSSDTALAQSTTPPASLLAAQQEAHRRRRVSTAQERRDRIQAVIDMVIAVQDELVAAVDEDFGGRHPGFTLTYDVLGSITALKHARDNLDTWMLPQERPPFAPYDALGATARVEYQAKGSVAIIGTWNAPVFTLLSPLAGVLAAGNRAILKPSEVVPRTADVLVRAVAAHLDPTVVAAITGGPDVAQELTSAPFDHIVFTGGAVAGRSVMENAARNLVPVTLELGGKSPTIVSRDADVATAAERIAIGKASNAGQFCVNPDTVYVAHEVLDEFVDALARAHAGLVPTAAGNADAVSVVNDRHAARVDGYVAEAAERGARVVCSPDEPVSAEDRRRPLRIVVDPPADTAISREEIFGPAVVVRGFDVVDDVIAEINAGPKPLALYYFGPDGDERRTVVENTTSGGVTINDVMMHPGMLDAPFGGVGASGMGRYNGIEGFLEFSHHRTVFVAPDVDPRREWGMLPPYHDGFRGTVAAQVTP